MPGAPRADPSERNYRTGLRPVAPAMNPSVQSPKVHLEIQPVFKPRHPVDTRSGLRTDRPIRRPQTIDVNVTQERGEPHILVLPRHSAHAIQPTWRALPGTESGTRRTGHVPLRRSPSLHHLRNPNRGVVRQLRRYYEIVGLSTIVHHRITTLAFPARPAPPSRRAGDHGTSRFSYPEMPYMHRFFDPAGSGDDSRKRRRRCCLPPCRTASAPQTRRLRGSIARPARTPTDASPPPSRTTTHGSGPPRLATPSMLDSLIPFSGPVYPGAPYTNPGTERVRMDTSLRMAIGSAERLGVDPRWEVVDRRRVQGYGPKRRVNP